MLVEVFCKARCAYLFGVFVVLPLIAQTRVATMIRLSFCCLILGIMELCFPFPVFLFIYLFCLQIACSVLERVGFYVVNELTQQ